MGDYITLLGAEDVSRAASNIRSAANDINRAILNLDELSRRHQRFMEEWLQTFERILLEHRP